MLGKWYGHSMTQQFELAVIVSLVVWYTIWAGMRRPGNGRAKNGESWQNGQEGESIEAVFEMQGGIHYFVRGVPLLSLLEAVIHEDSEGSLYSTPN